MAYVPKSPPFNARATTIAGSLLAEIPVTSVTEVTPTGPMNLPLVHDSSLAQMVRQWLREDCVTSSHCLSSVRGLHQAFLRWAGFSRNSDAEAAFEQELQTLGFPLGESGMVPTLVLATDFLAALNYQRGDTSLPADGSRNLTIGEGSMAMIISTKPKQYEIPGEGEHRAVLCDIVDLGEVDTAYGKKDKIRFIWLVDQRDSAGKQLQVAYSYTKSLHEKASLRKVIKAILGRDPGDTFDVETLLGTNVRLVIEHVSQDERTFAGIAAILKPRKGDSALTIPADFIRSKDRNGGANGSAGAVAPRVVQPKGGNGGGAITAKESRRQQKDSKRGRGSKPLVPNIHDVDVTDSDVQFPGDDDEAIPA
jgi:hypothetical protein